MSACFARRGLGVQTYIIEEKGRFAVYLDVAMAAENEASEARFNVVRRRIHDSPSQREAEVAVSWIGRGAARDLVRPPYGS